MLSIIRNRQPEAETECKGQNYLKICLLTENLIRKKEGNKERRRNKVVGAGKWAVNSAVCGG